MPCVFCCSTGPLTNEHTIPAWVGKQLGQGPVTHEYTPWRADQPAWSFRKKKLSLEARAVCEPCNTGWMSALEDDVAPVLTPLIAGEEQAVGATHRELLASWAIKTILMLQQAMLADSRASSPADYRDFYARRRPPRGARLWLAASEERHAGSTGPLSLAIDRPPYRRENFWAAFLYLGHAIFLIAGPGLSSPPALRPDYSQWTVPLWPGLEAVRWPPSTRLSLSRSAFCRSCSGRCSTCRPKVPRPNGSSSRCSLDSGRAEACDTVGVVPRAADERCR